eukprot:TRINITY_DN56894_c0_g1_i1.p1 TRINITY_DN56894_c0_g1~~TRINITY_DN56894_c0_g1_i1.p1  ORF type:complete len:257 (-),score=47.08 TRINITY_DN56894_c0_g1_i1:44-814(-)
MASEDINERLVLFVQCALFTVLRVSGAYPAESFHRRRLFGSYFCWWSGCAEVDEYVTTLCESLRPAIARDRLRRLLVPLRGQSGELLERYAIEFTSEPYRLAACSNDEICNSLARALAKLELSPACIGREACIVGCQDDEGSRTWSVIVETKPPLPNAPPRDEALDARWEMATPEADAVAKAGLLQGTHTGSGVGGAAAAVARRHRRQKQASENSGIVHPLAWISEPGGGLGETNQPGVVICVYLEEFRDSKAAFT